MKSTLIFLFLFFLPFLKGNAKTQDINSIKNLKDISETVFTTKDRETFSQGGLVIKRFKNMTNLFPPYFSEVSITYSSEQKIVSLFESKPEISWSFVIFRLIFPILIILTISMKMPEEHKKILLISYLCFVFTAAYPALNLTLSGQQSAAEMFLSFVFAFACIVFAYVYAKEDTTGVLFALIAISSVLNLVFIAFGVRKIFYEKLFLFEYSIFILIVCVVSFYVRYLHLKREERKEITLATI